MLPTLRDGLPLLALLLLHSFLSTAHGALNQARSDGIQAAVCGEKTSIYHTAPTTGVLHSPGWPDPFPSRVHCFYNLTTSPSNVIHLVFSHFDLSSRSGRSHQCLDAYILIIVVDRQGKQHIGERICGGDPFDRVFETMQPQILIEFTSFTNSVRKGFKIEYQFISEASIRQPPSYYFDADRTYEASCGGRNEIGSQWGEIISPGFPSTFPRNISCSWLIRVDPSLRIYVRLVYLNFADIKECEFGVMSVIDGYRHELKNSGRHDKQFLENSEAKFCGNLQSYQEEGLRSYISTGNRLLVKFQTGPRPPPLGSEEQKVGFKLIWTAVHGIVDENAIVSKTTAASCSQFVCNGGLLCMDQGEGICSARSQLCIDSSLVCNGVPNCAEGDFSDEMHCHSVEIVVAGGAAFCILLALIVAAICFERVRRQAALNKAIRSERGSSSKNGRPVWEESRSRQRVR